MAVRLPEGTSPNVQFRDLLPNGLIFLNDNSTTVAFVSDNGIASTATGTLPVPAIPNACNLTGTVADATTPPSSSITCVLADANIGSSNSTTANVDTYASGTDPYFKLGNLTNSDDDDDEEYAIIEFNALVHNQATNQNDNAENIDNRVRAYINNIQSGNDLPQVRVTVVEPFLTLDKTNSAISATVDAGDTVTYTITLDNLAATSTATAFDVHFVDALNASYLTLVPASVSVSFSGASSVVTDNSAANTLDIIITSIPVGNTVTITYDATLTGSVTSRQAIDNTGDVTWTSLPGPNGTSPNNTGSVTPGASGTDTGERNGSGGANNDHNATDTSTFNVSVDPFFSKSIELTSVPGTTSSNSTIGEVVTFGLYATLPEGTTPSLQLVDDLPAGMAYIDASYILVTTQPPAACGSLTADFAGTVPAPTLTVTPPVGGVSAVITFDFGAITAVGDNDATNNTFLICFEAVVLNVAGNQDGDTLTNNATMQAGTLPVQSASIDVNVVEPVMQIAKTVNELFPIPSQVLTFTLTVDHTSASTADAYDVIIFDDLPANLTLDLGSIVATHSGGVTGLTDTSAGNRVEVQVDEFPNGGSLIVQFEATFSGNLGDTLTNTGNITWTSTPDINPDERMSGGGVNDYESSDDVGLANTRELEKSLVTSNHPNTSFPDVAIGEILTYQVVLTFPANSTDTAVVVDTLDSGLAFMDCSDITAGFNITSSVVDFTATGNCNPGTTLANNPQIQNSGGVI